MMFLVFFGVQEFAFGLEPEEVLVIANKNVKGSIDIAQYYMKKRGIPESHLLALALTADETMSRQEYDKVLSPSTEDVLRKLRPEIRIAAIVLVYGVPLKVAPPLPSEKDKEAIRVYQKEKVAVAANLRHCGRRYRPKNKGAEQKNCLVEKHQSKSRGRFGIIACYGW